MVAEKCYRKPFPLAGLFALEMVSFFNRKGEHCCATQQNSVACPNFRLIRSEQRQFSTCILQKDSSKTPHQIPSLLTFFALFSTTALITNKEANKRKNSYLNQPHTREYEVIRIRCLSFDEDVAPSLLGPHWRIELRSLKPSEFDKERIQLLQSLWKGRFFSPRSLPAGIEKSMPFTFVTV